MAEQTDLLEKHIQSKRNELGQNLEELESKVKSAGDWHTYFERYPMTALGISFGGGILLSMLMGSSRSNRGRMVADNVGWQENQSRALASSPRPVGGARDKMAETVDTIKGALFGLATAKVQDILSDAIPGFREQYQKSERQKDYSGYSESKPVM